MPDGRTTSTLPFVIRHLKFFRHSDFDLVIHGQWLVACPGVAGWAK